VLAMPVTYLTPVRTSRRYGPYVPGFSYLSNTFSLVTATGAVSNSWPMNACLCIGFRLQCIHCMLLQILA